MVNIQVFNPRSHVNNSGAFMRLSTIKASFLTPKTWFSDERVFTTPYAHSAHNHAKCPQRLIYPISHDGSPPEAQAVNRLRVRTH